MRWKSLALVVLLLAGVGGALGFYWPFGHGKDILTLPGIVEIQEVRLGSRVSGRVAKLLVHEGDQVETGQELLRLDVPDLQAQRAVLEARVLEAKAASDRARNGSLPEEKEAARAAVEAAQVRLARLRNGFREEEKQQAESDYQSALADVRLAQEEYSRMIRLVRTAAGAQAELDSCRATLERVRGKVASARARRDLYQRGSRPEDVQEAQAEVKRLQAQAQLLERGTRAEDIAASQARWQEAKARLAELEVNLREAVVRATEPAVIEIVTVRPGDLVQAGQPLVRVLRRSDLWVKTYVPETDLGKVRLGMDVQVRIDSYPRRLFAGKVTHIGGESEFTPRNVQTVDERRHQMFGLRVRIDDTQGVFKSGMAAEVYLPLGR